MDLKAAANAPTELRMTSIWLGFGSFERVIPTSEVKEPTLLVYSLDSSTTDNALFSFAISVGHPLRWNPLTPMPLHSGATEVQVSNAIRTKGRDDEERHTNSNSSLSDLRLDCMDSE
ncbi:hypothetical protein NMY22_g13498 [Coprinellus aureogranulatus]|nr:hypothetical protein NMY22_g13498 [Coprinellus aureogranulatus]